MSLTPEQEELAKELSDLQRNLVLGVVAGKTQRQAYYDAGGKATSDESADANASKLLSMDKVAAFKMSLIESDVKESIMEREEALERLSLMGRTRITDILEFEAVEVATVNKDGEEETKTETIWRLKDSAELQERAAAAIKSVTMTKFGPKVEMHDAASAIAQIAKLRGWEAPTKVAQTDSQGNDVKPEAHANAVLAALARKHNKGNADT